MMHRKPATLIVLIAGCVAAAGCGASSDQPADAGEEPRFAENGTFTMAMTSELNSFDIYGPAIFQFANLAYDSLVNLQPDGTYVSGLAEDWTVDTTTATFTLRSDVTCSDGTEFTASQVAGTLTHLQDPATQSALAGSLLPKVPFTVTADDAARTVRVATDAPYGLLLETIGVVPIVCASGIENPDSLQTATAGTGPYVLTELVPGQSMTFSVRDDYTWGPDGASTSAPGTPSTIVIRSVANETTAANLLLSGELNAAEIVGLDATRLAAQGLEKLERRVSGIWLWFNQMDGRPAEDIQVREALVRAMDLDEVIKVTVGDLDGGPATGSIETEPKICPGDTVSGQLPDHDVAAAEALLDEAGWIKETDGIRRKAGRALGLDLHLSSAINASSKPSAELVRQQWEAIGAQVTLTDETAAQLSQTIFQTSDYDVWMYGIGLTLPTQLIHRASGPTPPDGGNLSGIDNPDYSALAAQAQEMTAPEACEHWAQAEQALWRDLDLVPISWKDRPLYLAGVQAESAGWSIPIATSIRVLD